MATNENPKDARQDCGATSEETVPDAAKKSKKGCVLLGCIVALLMLFFPFAPFTTLFLIAVVLLTVFLDKRAKVSDPVRKHNTAHPETSSGNAGVNEYSGLLGILVALLFLIGISVLKVILRHTLWR